MLDLVILYIEDVDLNLWFCCAICSGVGVILYIEDVDLNVASYIK